MEDLQKCFGVEVKACVSAQSVAMNTAMTPSGRGTFKSRGLADEFDVLARMFRMGIHFGDGTVLN
jgi:hypothetical protein